MKIGQFNKILPPLSIEKILELVRREQDAKRLEAQRQEAQRQEVERREAQRRDAERRKQEAQKREVEKQALLDKLKDQFDQDFLNIDNFYQAQCTEHILFEEYQSEKLNYVQSWVQINLNSSPDKALQKVDYFVYAT